ncbi:nucleotidyltransferase family protein [Brevibacillus porteri]|uniref:Alcohol dehydrogenase n=1 Tax=Brevibacillus porteri TaxID=2126350 RepID=A0ABX5FPV8_9BACL|nr:nucleotidyltransferase family protein [Brevibacillus porteri]MED1801458.1 nucleotidyltransferase family protein [Brevibacillus porteri]MED2133839.1 nucleotidyltransferase family protein [Brevibacillus porteri]MED2748245.1 nucleotidyltransferase family protein [Brevibacillus porteri]MED2815383.1 nucleotidyltransferase family protein [Brevibacillus porteri]MED2894810.1 nucleotidyltransferase family protein [Brevibacillus porteri]
MNDWTNILISPTTPILKAIEIIDAGARQLALVVDDDNRLLGTVTDGDIRRGLLKGKLLNDPVEGVMNSYPTVASPYDTRENILALMKVRQLHQIPVVDDDGRVIHVEMLNDLLRPILKDNWIVLMAGGQGTRLQPLTYDCPKPLLKVGNKPLLETILLNFIEHGFHKFYISVNYKAEMIQEYFGDGSRWNVTIKYLNEEKSLGTAGALSLLPEKPTLPLLVMNGDLLTKINFEQLLDFHIAYQAKGTMCVREYDFQVPYGVVKVDKQRMVGIEEKPVQRFFVNAGIYVLDPSVIEMIPSNEFFDMPSLFDKFLLEEQQTIVFPIREYWLDIGRLSDFERANVEFAEVFG